MLNLFDQNDIPTDFASLEAIDFQGSSFLDSVAAEFDKVHEFTRKYNADFNIDPIKGTLTTNDAMMKHDAIRAFFVKEISPGLKKIIKTNTNFVVSKFILDLPTNQDKIGSIYCWVETASSDQAAMDVITAAEGLSEVTLTNKSDVTKELTNISKSLNRGKGKIMKGIKPLTCKIGIPISMFCFTDFLPKDIAKSQPTSQELAAALGHEIGHVFGFVEYLADLAYTGYYGNNLIRNVDNLVKEDPQAAARMAKKLHKHTKPKFIKESDKIVNKLTDLERSEYEKSHIWMFLLKVVISSIILLDGLFIGLVIAVQAMFSASDSSSSSNVKNSREFYIDTKNRTMYERLADEYVSRQGYSLHLNRMLDKLGKVFEHMHKVGWGYNRFDLVARHSLGIRSIHTLVNTPYYVAVKLLMLVSGKWSSYESDEKRLKRNVQNMYDLLNDGAIPNSMKSEFANQADKMKNEIGMINFRPGVILEKTTKFIVTLIPKLLVGGWRTLFSTGGLDRNYIRLIEQADELLSNKAGYAATKVRDLMR